MPKVVPFDRQFEDLPKRNQVFVEQYVLSGDCLQAFLAAGYKDSATAKKKAVQMRSNLREHIVKKTRELSENVDMAIVALKTVRELAESAESEAVRLNAAKELIARAMPEAPQEVNHNHTHSHSHLVRNLSDEEIDARIAKLTSELQPNQGMIDVTPGQTAEAG